MYTPSVFLLVKRAFQKFELLESLLNIKQQDNEFKYRKSEK